MLIMTFIYYQYVMLLYYQEVRSRCQHFYLASIQRYTFLFGGILSVVDWIHSMTRNGTIIFIEFFIEYLRTNGSHMNPVMSFKYLEHYHNSQ
jgi:hypothetical protein